jgi:hypothetical protein
LYFQIIDDKTECIGIYANEKLYYDEAPRSISATWKYAPILRDRNDIKYASLYCGNHDLQSSCPEHLENRLNNILDKFKAYLISFHEAKISLYDNCFYDLVPERFVLEYCDVKNEITKHILENYSRPKNYNFLVSLSKVLEDIKYQSLNLDFADFDFGSTRGRMFHKKIKQRDKHIVYDLFGAKTGRLTTKKKSFPILTMDKKYRGILKPKNDYFIELDFNSAEIRTFLALQGLKQPKEDIHTWIGENVFKGQITREESKKKFFAWLYNPEAINEKLEKIFDKKKILDNYWDGYKIRTNYDREIEAGPKHALNYLIQSTTSDLFLRRMIDVWHLLKTRTSFVAFCIHDSLVIDFSVEDKLLLQEIMDKFSDTELGVFKANVSVGKNFGDMRKLEWKQ